VAEFERWTASGIHTPRMIKRRELWVNLRILSV